MAENLFYIKESMNNIQIVNASSRCKKEMYLQSDGT